jgi:hypothetical protein
MVLSSLTFYYVSNIDGIAKIQSMEFLVRETEKCDFRFPKSGFSSAT